MGDNEELFPVEDEADAASRGKNASKMNNEEMIGT